MLADCTFHLVEPPIDHHRICPILRAVIALREPHVCHLWVSEGYARNRLRCSIRTRGQQGVAHRDGRLYASVMSELMDGAGTISRGINIRHTRAKATVHLNTATLRQFYTDPVKPERFGVGRTPGGDQHSVHRVRLLARSYHQLASLSGEGGRTSLHMLYSILHERFHDYITRCRILFWHDFAGENDDLASKALVRLCDLASYRPPSEYT
mmetsp:Transcript_92/g.210  ORF Transcript_92/g.210 Transcript_92/m.210 type:complete len:210 (-) Transcript_92:580-1209(-)